MKKNIITLAGDLASGKGTVAKILSDKLNFEVYSNGKYFRELAKKFNMSVTEFNKYVEEHPDIDRNIEKSAEEYTNERDNLVIDARLGFFVVKGSFNVYLKVDIDEAARRAFNDEKRHDTESFESIEEHKNDLIKRFKLENERYFKLYGIRKDNLENYHVVIDTTNLMPEEVAKIIIEKFEKWKHE